MSRPVKQPDESHPITVEPTGSRVIVTVNGHKIADTRNALSLRESTYPVVQYVPLADVDPSVLRRTDTETYCPYKGAASYYSVETPDGATEVDLIWEYQQPYDAVKEIAGHVAFYANRAKVEVVG